MYEYPTDARNRNSQVLRQERNMRRIFASATVRSQRRVSRHLPRHRQRPLF
jgi:hypothetical protein